jgi:hypothetical protein
MSKPTIQEFENCADWCNGVEFYGQYEGRCYYKGIAVSADSFADAAQFMCDMAEAGYPMGQWDHEDNLGLGVIVAWRPHTFSSQSETGA